MFTRAQRGCVIQTYQNKNTRLELGPGDVGDDMPGSVGRGFWGFEKKQRFEFLPSTRVEIQSWARPDEFVRYGHHVWLG